MNLSSEAIGGAARAIGAIPRPARSFELDEAESARFLRIVRDSLSISRHYQLFRWLSGELQQFLPHQILISAWGNFASGELQLDLVSALPGVRTAALAHCSIDAIVRDAHVQWTGAGCRPLVLSAGEIAAPPRGCTCHIHGALASMRSVLVHGVHDERSGYDSLYIALNTGSFTKGRCSERFMALVDSLIAQIDLACRKVAALRLVNGKRNGELAAHPLDLSARELEILDWVCRGNTNLDIAQALDISLYTVKNHVQRIFRKIGVSNRTQAAAKYHRLRRMEAR